MTRWHDEFHLAGVLWARSSCHLVILSLGLVGLVAVGCRPLTGPPGPPQPGSDHPRPVEIRWVAAADENGEATLAPGDPGFDEAAAGLAALLAQVDSQARTFFDPARFEDEVAPEGYVHIRYEEELEFAGQGISWRAVELVASVVGGEAMLLARDAQSPDWSVYLPASQGAMDDFLDVVAAQIGAP